MAGHAGGDGDQRHCTATSGDGDNAERGTDSSAANCAGDFDAEPACCGDNTGCAAEHTSCTAMR